MDDNNEYFSGEVLSIVLFNNVFYYVTHYLMHYSEYLKPIHRYHHLYKKNIIPSVGNAVTIKEMFLAYLTPFVCYSMVFNPEMNSLIIGIAIISVFNLIVHSTYLSNFKWPSGFVSPSMHVTHHNLYLKHFAAPVFNIDWLYANTKRIKITIKK